MNDQWRGTIDLTSEETIGQRKPKKGDRIAFDYRGRRIVAVVDAVEGNQITAHMRRDLPESVSRLYELDES